METSLPDNVRRRLLLTATKLGRALGAYTALAYVGLRPNHRARSAPAPPTNPRLDGQSATASNASDIPSIAWVPRSDWINVRTDIDPPASGDGRTDDTRALQRALDRLGADRRDPKVIYLPAGTYRITRTLVLRRCVGGLLVGDGGATILLWDGPRAGRMFWSDGAAYQSYLGLVWDGAGTAAVGIDHASKTLYETRVMHEFMEFRNFQDAGIRVGYHQKVASAEMMYSNVSFRNNRNGVAFLSWNDYNNIFDGCHFYSNGCAIRVEKGNVVVRNSRFVGNRQCDLLLSTHSHSVRRCVSIGSNAFIRTVRGPLANGLIRVEDCRVDGWLDPDGAIVAGLRGPILVFDSAFTNPPSKAPPIRLDNPPYMNQIAVLSNVTSDGTRSTIATGPNGIVNWLPDGGRGAPLVSLNQTFLKNSYPTGDRVLDVKRDFKARGDGSADDTRAIQRAFNAAHKLGKGTTVYFPSGLYRITTPLRILPGASYAVEGTGWHSQIVLMGTRAGNTLHVDTPSDLVLTRMGFGGPPRSDTIRHTASGTSRAHYHNVFGYNRGERQDLHILFDSLPSGAVVTTGHLDGRVRIRKCSKATIIFGFLGSVQTTVGGNAPPGGVVGILSRVSALAPTPLVVNDNQSLIVTDWYNEQSSHLSRISGMPGASGQVVLDHTQAASRASVFTEIDGYHGMVAEFGGMFGVPMARKVHTIAVRNGGGLTLVIAASMFWFTQPRIEGSPTHVAMIGNSVAGRVFQRNEVVATTPGAAAADTCALALAAFRRLGAADLALNYGLTAP